MWVFCYYTELFQELDGQWTARLFFRSSTGEQTVFSSFEEYPDSDEIGECGQILATNLNAGAI